MTKSKTKTVQRRHKLKSYKRKKTQRISSFLKGDNKNNNHNTYTSPVKKYNKRYFTYRRNLNNNNYESPEKTPTLIRKTSRRPSVKRQQTNETVYRKLEY